MTAASQVVSEQAVRRVSLTKKGRQIIETAFTKSDVAEPPASDGYEVLLDTRTLVLTRSGARLVRRADVFELQVLQERAPRPLLAEEEVAPPVPGRARAYESLQKTQDIASVLGLEPEDGTSGDAKDFTARLAKAGVRPLVRWRTERARFKAPGGAAAFPAPFPDSRGRGVEVVLECVHFDTAFAEPAAIAELLSKDASEAHPELSCAFAECRMPVSGAGSSAAVRSVVDELLRTHGLDEQGGGSRPHRSALAAYLQLCRPVHFWKLCDAGIDPNPPEEALPALTALREDSDEDDTVYRI